MATSTLPPCVKLTGGKRGAPGPLIVTTSDEDSSDGEAFPHSPRAPTMTSRISPRVNITDTYPNLKLDLTRALPPERTGDKSEPFRLERSEVRAQPPLTNRTSSPSPTPGLSAHRQACDAYEHDHDYENVASPSGSSTASGPVYVRPPGFEHHGQEIRRKKKKSNGLLEKRNGLKSRAPTPPKVKPRREPIPMRLRALPQSFWKQPNNPTALSPGTIYSSLPPLSYCTKDEDMTDVRPITPPADKDKKHTKMSDRKIIVSGDTDLILKHLFADVDEKKVLTPSTGQTPKTNSSNVAHLKRGRPPKKINMGSKTSTKGLLTSDDPYLMDGVAAQKRFPQLSFETSVRQPYGAGNSSLQLITLREGDKSVTLPSLSIEQNYAQMLSELVMNI